MTALPLSQDLFIRWMQQGMKKGYIHDCEPTLNGQAYISASFIRQQSIDRLEQNKGRTTVTRLAESLNLPVSTLERYLTSQAQEQEWTLIDDHLLTKIYLGELKLVCLDHMKEHGYISLVAQTQATSLPYRLLQKILDVNTIDDCIRYSDISDLLFTKVYVDQQKHRIIDHLQSSTEPLAMQKLQKDLELTDVIFYIFLEQIIKDHNLQGTFRGRRERALFIPHVYRDTQLAMIDSLLKAGNYIEYNTVEQLYGFAAPKDLLLKLDVDIILLDTCAITESISASFEETLLSSVNFTWIDASNYLPSSLSLADITTLLEIILPRLNSNKKKKKAARSSPQPDIVNGKAQHQETFVLLGKFVTTTRFLEITLVENAQPFLNQRASVELSRNQKFLHSNKGKRKKDLQVILTNEEIQHHLIEEQHLPSEFAPLVTTRIKRSIVDGMDRAMKQIYINTETTTSGSGDGSSWLDKQQQHLEFLLGDLRSKIYYNMKSIALFEDSSTRKSMEKYMVRQLCGEFLFYLVLVVTLWQSTDQSEMTSITGLRNKDIERPDTVDDNQKTQVIAALVSSDTTNQKELEPLHQALQGGKKMDAFTSFISTPPSSSFIIEKLHWTELDNEETQSQFNANFRTSLQQQLEHTAVSESAAPSILHLTTLLCFQSIYGLPLNVSGKYVPSILKAVAQKLHEHTGTGMLYANGNMYIQQLEEAQHSIMANIKVPCAIDLDLISSIRQLGLDLCHSPPP